MRGKSKPIRVFWSAMSQRFYATRAYREIKPNVIEVTGEKFDVTDEIAALIVEHKIEFSAEPRKHEGEVKS